MFAQTNKTNKTNIANIITGLIAFILTALFILPYVYLFLTSFKPSTEIFSTPPTLFPSKFTLSNYLKVGEYLPIYKYFINSLSISITSTFFSVLVGGIAAYRISRYKSKLSNIFLVFTLATRMIPYISIAIPIYRLVSKVGLMDTKISLIFAYTCLNIPFVIWLMVSFFDGVPKELDEAAKVDGCNQFSAFFRIILPVSITGLATTAIFSFMLAWNDFLFALLFTSTRAKTVPIGISEFLTVYNIQWGPMAAAAIMFSLPVLILTFLIQRKIVEGLTLGAIKG